MLTFTKRNQRLEFGKSKAKFTLEQTVKVHRGSKSIPLLFLQPRGEIGVGG